MNWGTKIVIGMATFMLFIIVLVAYMFKVHGNDALVEEDYYEKGLNYNQEYVARQNTINSKAEPKITINPNQLLIQLKDSASYELKLMRPSAKKEDVNLKGNTIGQTHLILIDRLPLAKGMWTLELKWKANQQSFYYKKDLTL